MYSFGKICITLQGKCIYAQSYTYFALFHMQCFANHCVLLRDARAHTHTLHQDSSLWRLCIQFRHWLGLTHLCTNEPTHTHTVKLQKMRWLYTVVNNAPYCVVDSLNETSSSNIFPKGFSSDINPLHARVRVRASAYVCVCLHSRSSGSLPISLANTLAPTDIGTRNKRLAVSISGDILGELDAANQSLLSSFKIHLPPFINVGPTEGLPRVNKRIMWRSSAPLARPSARRTHD